jgi:hypothetical protein
MDLSLSDFMLKEGRSRGLSAYLWFLGEICELKADSALKSERSAKLGELNALEEIRTGEDLIFPRDVKGCFISRFCCCLISFRAPWNYKILGRTGLIADTSVMSSAINCM